MVYLGSFSKTFAPGFRVGWAVAPHAVREKLVLASESAILCPSAFSQLAVATYLEDHDWKHQVGIFRELYRERARTTLDALADLLPGATWTTPRGGFYVWVTLPEGLDATAMLPRAVTERVAYVPGTAFFADGQGRRSLRLSYCYPTPERIREGVRRLASVVEAETELLETFGAGGGAPTGRPPRGRLPRPRPLLTLRGIHVPPDPSVAPRGVGMTLAPRVLVLAGGLSHERDVSLRSGRRVAEFLRDAGCAVLERDVDANLVDTLSGGGVDVVWPLLHGATGEDGSVRDVFELVGVPYVGSGPAACRSAWDKSVAGAVGAGGRAHDARPGWRSRTAPSGSSGRAACWRPSRSGWGCRWW